jgi:hypothetical protein
VTGDKQQMQKPFLGSRSDGRFGLLELHLLWFVCQPRTVSLWSLEPSLESVALNTTANCCLDFGTHLQMCGTPRNNFPRGKDFQLLLKHTHIMNLLSFMQMFIDHFHWSIRQWNSCKHLDNFFKWLLSLQKVFLKFLKCFYLQIWLPLGALK